MDQLSQKDFTCSRGFNYHYYISAASPANSSKPALIFLHGWPDSSALWQFIAPKFHELGYRVVVPDLLGYGDTSKPTDTKSYTWGYQAQDLIELVDHEGISKIIPVGHDWGSAVAQRLYHFFPDNIVGIILLSVAYRPPYQDDKPLSTAVNDHLEKVDGYRRFEYQTHFIEPDAAKLWNDHLESAWTAYNASGIELGKKMFCEPGVMRSYISADRRDNPVKPYAQNPAIRDPWIAAMRNGGFEGPFSWYRAFWEGVHGTPEKDLPQERAKVNVPMLYMYCDGDVVCLGKDILPHAEAGLVPDLEMHEIESGHWVPYENPEEVNRLMEAWLKAKQL